MNVTIATTVSAMLIAHAAREFPREACGILFGHPDAIEATDAVANVAANPARGFEIEPAALLRAHREARGQGRMVVGWYHSHPNGVGQPSATDAARAVEDGKLWLVVAGDSVSAWRVVPDGPVHGRFRRVALTVV